MYCNTVTHAVVIYVSFVRACFVINDQFVVAYYKMGTSNKMSGFFYYKMNSSY